MCQSESGSEPEPRWDPTFVNTRREAKIIFCLWFAALLWTIPFSYLHGYDSTAAIDMVWGIPSWVFWGVALPWLLTSLFALWFSFRGIADDDLGRAPDEEI
jgi:hypothetical protein